MMSESQSTIFTNHIRRFADQYFTGLELSRISVQLEETLEHTNSMLYRFSVDDTVQNHIVLVKVPLFRGGIPVNEPEEKMYFKPRLFPRTEPRDMPKLEYMALSAIYEYFNDLDDKHLGAIRALDYLPDHRAILMEESRDPSLRQLFLRASRLQFTFKPSGQLIRSFENTGNWLRRYHEMPKESNVTIRHAHRHEFVEGVTVLTGFLSEVLRDEEFFQIIASILKVCAINMLPESLPLGLGHGDFAMRNILVGSNSRITVIDTFAKWQTPIYEDVGYFLNELKMSGLQVASQGLAFSSGQFAAYERAFLNGYFGQETIPYPAVRLYEILALLDKWSSVVTRYRQQKIRFDVVGDAKVAILSRYFKKNVNQLLEEVTKGPKNT